MIINQIKAMEKAEDAAQSGIRNTESAKVFNIEGDSDALIVKGLIAILLSLYQGKTLIQAKEIDPRVEFEKLGLNSHLSSQRSNGLKSMIDQIKIFVNT